MSGRPFRKPKNNRLPHLRMNIVTIVVIKLGIYSHRRHQRRVYCAHHCNIIILMLYILYFECAAAHYFFFSFSYFHICIIYILFFSACNDIELIIIRRDIVCHRLNTTCVVYIYICYNNNIEKRLRDWRIYRVCIKIYC